MNEQMDEAMRVPSEWLAGLNVTDDGHQTVEDLVIFFVVKDTLQETLAYNWELIKLTQPAVYRTSFSTNKHNLRLSPGAMVYEPGAHRIRISLVNYWPYKDGQTVNGVSKPVSVDNTKLAGVEAFAAYALQSPHLLQLQDGFNLPHCKLAGLQQGHLFNKVPFFYWDFISKRACLIVSSLNEDDGEHRPLLIG